MTSAEFARESLTTCWDELQPLARAHWTEIGSVVQIFADIQANPNREAYFAAEEIGVYRAYVARVNGRAIGYSTYFVAPSLQHGCVTAMHDVLFVDRAHRRGGLAYALLKFCDEDLKSRGVQFVVQESPSSNDIGILFKRLGYVPLGMTHVRRL